MFLALWRINTKQCRTIHLQQAESATLLRLLIVLFTHYNSHKNKHNFLFTQI